MTCLLGALGLALALPPEHHLATTPVMLHNALAREDVGVFVLLIPRTHTLLNAAKLIEDMARWCDTFCAAAARICKAAHTRGRHSRSAARSWLASSRSGLRTF